MEERNLRKEMVGVVSSDKMDIDSSCICTN